MAGTPLHWVPVYFTFRTHRKVVGLSASLKIPLPIARMAVIELWLYTAAYHTGGTIPPDQIAGAVHFIAHECLLDVAATSQLQDALVAGKILDIDDTGFFRVHGWEDHAGRKEAKNEYDRLEKRRQRASSHSDGKHVAATSPRHLIDGATKEEEIKVNQTKPNTNHATACSDMLIPSPEAPQSLPAQNPTPETPKGKKRRRSLPAVSLSPELTGLVDRWRKPVNKRIVAELVAKRVEEGYTEAEMVAGGDDYLSTRKGQEARFDMMLETFVGPALHFKTEWIKRVARPKLSGDDRRVIEEQRQAAVRARRNERYIELMAKRKREAVAAGQEFIATPEIIAAVNAELDKEFGEGKL